MSLLRRFELEDRRGSSQGSLNGTTSVEIVAAPASGFVREVDFIDFFNCDSAAVDIRIRKTITGPIHYEFDRNAALAVNGHFAPLTTSKRLQLTATSQSVTAVMGAAKTTTDPTWIASWKDIPVAT